MSSDHPVPITTFPDDVTARAWPDRTTPAAVTVRCGRGEQRCGRLLEIYETPRGGLVHFFTHTPDRPVHLAGLDALTDEMRAELTERYKKVDLRTGDALLAGRIDDRGYAVLLEDQAGWGDVVTVGCRRHLGTRDVSRAELMDWLRNARADRTGRLRITLRR